MLIDVKISQLYHQDALIISFADTFTSLLAGTVIFSILGHLAHELELPVEQVVKSGAGLAFVSYPEVRTNESTLRAHVTTILISDWSGAGQVRLRAAAVRRPLLPDADHARPRLRGRLHFRRHHHHLRLLPGRRPEVHPENMLRRR